MSFLIDRCIFVASSGGTGTFTVSTAVAGYMTPAQAGAIDGAIYSYAAESADLSQWEVGTGTYTASGTTLSRTVLFNSSGNTSAINFSVAPHVKITALAAVDLRNKFIKASTSVFISTMSFATIGTYASGGSFDQSASLTQGSSYPNGVYLNVPLTGGSGTGQKANIYVDFGFNITAGGSGYFAAFGGKQYYNVSGGSGTGGIINVTIVGGAITSARWVERGTGYLAGDVISVTTTFGGTGFSATLTSNSGKVTFVQPINGTAATPYAVGDNLSASNANLGGAGSGFSAHVYAIGNDTTGDGSEGKPYATLQAAWNTTICNVDIGSLATAQSAGSALLFQIVDGYYAETTNGVWFDCGPAGSWDGGSNAVIQGNSFCRTCVQASNDMVISGSIPGDVFVYSLGSRSFSQTAFGFADFDNCDPGIGGGTVNAYWFCQGFGSNMGVHGDLAVYSHANSGMFSQQGGFVNFGINTITINGAHHINQAFIKALEESYVTSGGSFAVYGAFSSCPKQVIIDDTATVDVSFGPTGYTGLFPGSAIGSIVNCGKYIYLGTNGRRSLMGADNLTVSSLMTPNLGLTLSNGLNSDIDISLGTSYSRISGPTGAFSVGGFIPPTLQTPVVDGIHLAIYNSTAQAMTIVNEDASSTAANRIKTLTGGNVVLRTGTSAATFIYDATDSRWILMGTN